MSGRVAASKPAVAGAPSVVSAKPLIEIEGLQLSFGSTAALAGIDLAILPGEFVTLLGPSGSGKTTLLRVIAGFLEPQSGDVRVAGKSVLGDPPERRPVNTVFQHYALFPHLNVAKNISFGLEVQGTPREEIRARVAAVLKTVQLDGYEQRMVDQLSGGQRQRVALARALVNQPRVLLLDEPLGALDLKLRREMQLELRALQRSLELTFIYVTHDQEEALVLSDRIAVMDQGRVAQFGTPVEVYRTPVSRFVAEFIGETNLLSGRAHGGEVIVADLALRFSYSATSDGDLLMSLRPHDISIGGMGSVRAEASVVDRVFLGADTRLVVRRADRLLTVVSRLPPANIPEVGALVELSWNPDDLAVVEL